MIRVPLTRGLIALVSEEDADRVLALKWHVRPVRSRLGKFIAVNGRGGAKPTRHGCRYLHRFILNAPADRLVDHINGDTLDNRRENLRLCTPSQNCINRPSIGGHGFRGVYLRRSGTWGAKIQVEGEITHLGQFATVEAAARAYDAAALQMHGEFACLNFPNTPLSHHGEAIYAPAYTPSSGKEAARSGFARA